MATKRKKRPPKGYMSSTFKARAYPEAIFFAPADGQGDGDVVAGPFCVHCGNPLSMHGDHLHCPDHTKHPLFPPPSCKCHGTKEPDA